MTSLRPSSPRSCRSSTLASSTSTPASTTICRCRSCRARWSARLTRCKLVGRRRTRRRAASHRRMTSAPSPCSSSAAPSASFCTRTRAWEQFLRVCTHAAAAGSAFSCFSLGSRPSRPCQPSTARTTRTRCKSSRKPATIRSLSWTSRLVCTRMSTQSNSTPSWTRVVRIQASQTPSSSTRSTTSRTASSLMAVIRTSSAASQPTRSPSLWSASAPCRSWGRGALEAAGSSTRRRSSTTSTT
mmetsp:Transcript_18826/g.60562  ORF Transcript_18826/g.60562 Transcript_18826/m.60562 type:complete len:242 (-) Transcript_18826:642-1367(-)